MITTVVLTQYTEFIQRCIGYLSIAHTVWVDQKHNSAPNDPQLHSTDVVSKTAVAYNFI